MAAKKKAEYAPPTSQVDLKQRLESGNASSAVLSTSDLFDDNQKALKLDELDEGQTYAVEGNDLSGYVATDPIYQTYANETEKPLQAEGDDNPEAELERAEFGQLPVKAWDTSEAEDDDDESSEDEPSKPAPPPAPSTN